MSSNFPAFAELIAQTKKSAIHLEMRDVYTPQGGVFVDWQAGIPIAFDRHTDWVDMVRGAVDRGVDWRRVRIVSEPVTDFIRYEWETTGIVNVPAGEKVRWLPRKNASDLFLPGNDFWVFDGRLLRWTHFQGDGSWGPHEFMTDPSLIAKVKEAFESAWERAIDHTEYVPEWKSAQPA